MKSKKARRLEVLLKYAFVFEGRRMYGSMYCLLENAAMIEHHLRKDGCYRVWIA